jgi:alpha-tubulin suppressor-like RCC1 family protein
VTTDFSGDSDDWIHDVAIQTDGRIVAVGNTGTGEVGSYSFALARYLP